MTARAHPSVRTACAWAHAIAGAEPSLSRGEVSWAAIEAANTWAAAGAPSPSPAVAILHPAPPGPIAPAAAPDAPADGVGGLDPSVDA